MVPRSSIPSSSKQNSAILMTVQEQIDTPTERKRGATRHGRRSHKTSHPKTNCVRNLLQRGRSETPQQRRCIADTAASLRSMTAGVKYCISDHFTKPRLCTVGQRNCIAKKERDAEFPRRNAACRRSYASERSIPWNVAGATCHSNVFKLRKTLLYSEKTCCEPEGTLASTKKRVVVSVVVVVQRSWCPVVNGWWRRWGKHTNRCLVF